ncbi:MAG: hypothetical protein Q8S26_01335 [Azonexus sp.]|nr:hypothetical protein [Azonexus sp.]
MLSRALDLILALASLLFGGWLAFNYPILQPLPIIGFILFAALIYLRPWLWPILVPGILPVIGLAPWTGWLTFEELDLLVLATAAGAYAKYFFQPVSSTRRHFSGTLAFLISLMAISLIVSMLRGFSDAGGFSFGWYQGYNGPMNSVRIAKSFFLALLLWPLLRRMYFKDEAKLGRNLGYGLSLGLGLASLAAIWERLAFTGLLNFSSDYRTTALFWEMHVGGAAFDGWLLLTFVFSIWALLRATGRLQQSIALAVIAIALYAAMTTFSRGVYLGLIVSLCWLLFLLRGGDTGQSGRQGMFSWFRQGSHWAALLAWLAIAVWLLFPVAGYRGLLALLGLVLVMLAMPDILRRLSGGKIILTVGLALIVTAPLIVLSNVIARGPYWLFAILLGGTMLSLYLPSARTRRLRLPVVLGGFVALLLATANVTGYWGGVEALPNTFLTLLMLIVTLAAATISKRPLWPSNFIEHGKLLILAIGLSGVLAVFLGGAYMGERFSTSGKDMETRLEHWNLAYSMLQSPMELAFGKGLGRFPANFYFVAPRGEFPGAYQVNVNAEKPILSLSGANHPMSQGDILRVSQRLGQFEAGRFEVEFKVRTNGNVQLFAEVCERHLLYVAACAVKAMSISSSKGEWQIVKARLDGSLPEGYGLALLKFKAFSFGVLNPAGAIEIDRVALIDEHGQNVLKNGDFHNEMQGWFMTSDHDHMPWHAKNLLVNLVFDQGLFGLLVFMLMTGAALWRSSFGSARHHALSPYLNAGIVGFLIVGLFDSLTDVPRLAFAYYFLLLVTLSLDMRIASRNKIPSSSTVPPQSQGER